MDVGVGYLTLDRRSNTLSGGETQRIDLATSLGSSLVGMYILDEPSIGLHPRDTQRLIGVLERLRDLGNTVVVVEHEEVMKARGRPSSTWGRRPDRMVARSSHGHACRTDEADSRRPNTPQAAWRSGTEAAPQGRRTASC